MLIFSWLGYFTSVWPGKWYQVSFWGHLGLRLVRPVGIGDGYGLPMAHELYHFLLQGWVGLFFDSPRATFEGL